MTMTDVFEEVVLIAVVLAIGFFLWYLVEDNGG